MSAVKRRKANTPESVPDHGDPDRKRVLNVLAQRRYRQRRREKIAALEAQAKNTSPLSTLLEDDGVQFQSLSESPSSSITVPENKPTEPEDVEELVLEPDILAYPMLDFEQSPMGISLFPDFTMSNLPCPLPPTPASLPKDPSPLHFPLTPDATHFAIPVLHSLRAWGLIATALNVLPHVYNPFYLHVLPPDTPAHLPPNLHPTPAQLAVPHHPILDTLPWPAVRTRLISMFALPSSLRPPIAQDEDGGEGQGAAVMRMVQDMDDVTEGVRCHGNGVGWGDGSELEEGVWEVGEAFYRNWWWCLDAEIVARSNGWRSREGRGILRLRDG